MAAIGAPEASSALFSAISSASETPAGGQGSRAEPPPVISAITRSSGPSPLTVASNRLAAAAPAASGTGWLASMISMFLQGAA